MDWKILASAGTGIENIKKEFVILGLQLGVTKMSTLSKLYGEEAKLNTFKTSGGGPYNLNQVCLSVRVNDVAPTYVLLSAHWNTDYEILSEYRITSTRPENITCGSSKKALSLDTYLGVNKKNIISRFGTPVKASGISDDYNTEHYLSFETSEIHAEEILGKRVEVDTLYAIVFKFSELNEVESYIVYKYDEPILSEIRGHNT